MQIWKAVMELRHLRYFVAVAEEGSLTVAAEKRLHTAQPSLSRQMRDLEDQVGVPLLSRSVHGVELTAAGRAFLDHARLALTQAEAAVEAARRAAQPAKPIFALGFLTGMEIDWLPKAMRILHDQLPNMKLTIASQYSPDLATELMRGRLDARVHAPGETNGRPSLPARADGAAVHGVPERSSPGRARGRRFAGHRRRDAHHSVQSRVDLALPDRRLSRESGLDIKPAQEVVGLAHAVSMVASTRAVMLLPAYARNLLPRSVTSRPLRGTAPTIDLVVGYDKANASPILELFLSRLDEITAAQSHAPPPPA